MSNYYFRMKKSNRTVGGKRIQVDPLEHYLYITRQGRYEKLGGLLKYINGNMDKIINLKGEKEKDFWKNCKELESVVSNKFRELEVSLPKELSDEENIEIALRYIDELFKGDFVYSCAVHKNAPADRDKNIHFHVMFSEKRIDQERTKESFFSHGLAGGPLKDREWQKKKKLFELRKGWEEFINIELEKRGLEKVSCLSLKEQKRIAELNGDYEKAKELDREPVNIEGYILYKKESELTEKELRKKREYLNQKEMKKIKEEIRKNEMTLKEFKKRYKLYQEWKQNNKDITFLIDQKLEAVKKLEKLREKSNFKKIEDTVLNQLTGNKYYIYLNDNKKIAGQLKKEKEENKIKALQIRRAKNTKKIEELRTKVLLDPILQVQFKQRVEKIQRKYDKKLDEEVQKIRTLDTLNINKYNEKYKNNTIGSMNHLMYIFENSGKKEFEKLGYFFEKDIEYYKKKLSDREIEKEIFNIISKGKMSEFLEKEKEVEEDIKKLKKELTGLKFLDRKKLENIEKEEKKLYRIKVKIEKIFEEAKDKKWEYEKSRIKEEYREKLKQSKESYSNWVKLGKILNKTEGSKNKQGLKNNIRIRELEEIDIEEIR